MRFQAFATAVLSILTVSCGGQPSRGPSALPLDPAERLEAILATPITAEQDSLYRRLAEDPGVDVESLLPALAVDASAPPIARANAVLRMGRQRIVAFDVYDRTIVDPDPRVRGATLGVVGGLMARRPELARPIIARGLADTEIGIQAKALQELRDQDLDLLRSYIAGGPPEELRAIALATLRAAQAWGAPVAPEADGSLRRVAPSGVELLLRRDTAWPEWEAIAGTLTVTTPDGASRVLADSVEAVAGVIPAVVDPGGRWVALETARRLEVHDLRTGESRVVDRGYAPRPLPFTPDFLYFREIHRVPMPEGSVLRYEMLRASFAEAGAAVFDTINVTARRDTRGFLSPIRWARIHDHGTRFVLRTQGLSDHALPSPIGAVSTEPDDGR